MKKNEFEDEVKEFADLYCPEFMRDYSVVFDMTDPDNLIAEINAEDYFGNHWRIPVWSDENEETCIPTTANGSGGLKLNGESFYCYLWHEAICRWQQERQFLKKG